jgi:hypothetical protein
VTGLFPPQERDWNLPTEGDLSTHAAERVVIEAVTGAFDTAATKLNHDWGTTLDGKQVQRWSERIGDGAVRRRDHAVQRMHKGMLPRCPANEHALLVIGLDGGRVQTRLKNQDGSRWREDKVVTVTSYLRGQENADGERSEPTKLVSSYLATMRDASTFGALARLEAERRGIRQAERVIVMGDGASWIDTIAGEQFPHAVRIVDWYHAAEHLHGASKAARPLQETESSTLADQWKTLLWEGQFDALLSALHEEATRAGEPPPDASAADPRQVLRRTVNYFASRRDQMDYPRYRAEGWPIGSGVTESGVKLYNKRVKGTEQFWNLSGVESILQLRSEWLTDPEDLHHRLWPPPARQAA